MSASMFDCSHRCDRCNSQAYVLTVLDFDTALGKPDELYWCRHHWIQHQPALEPLCGLIVDETERLFEHVQDDGHYIEGKPSR